MLSRLFASAVAALVIPGPAIPSDTICSANAFVTPINTQRPSRATFLPVPIPARARCSQLSSTTSSDGDLMDDETLLQKVDASYLQDLCKQLNLSAEGSKEELLLRLRTHADEQAKIERARRAKLNEEIESGIDEEGYPTKHRLVDDNAGFGPSPSTGSDNGEDEGAFYFELPGNDGNKKKSKSNDDGDGDDESDSAATAEKARKELDSALAKGGPDLDLERNNAIIDSQTNPITAPLPPPSVKPNEKGERVVTVYSTKDDNDMTSMNTEGLMGDPGQEGMQGGYSRTDGNANPEDTLAGGPFGDASNTQRRKTTEQELEDAKEVVMELMQGLLAMTGAPGFQDEFSGGVQPYDNNEDGAYVQSSVTVSSEPQMDFVGFDPSAVPTDMLTESSRSLRAGGGQAFREVLSDFEMQAVGHDGMSADDVSKGGGHYREVRKVGAFLEGYRRAEVRRIARETATMLLDKLVNEGVKGLDLILATMGKAGDDGAGNAGELNDSLTEYLNEAIRQQEKKVALLQGDERRTSQRPTEGSIRRQQLEDQSSGSLWNVTMEEGQVVETFDPSNPNIKAALEDEMRKNDALSGNIIALPTTAPEQLLLLLSCLRDRVRAEAAFATDEKGRNLRILAYIIHAANDEAREQIITSELGSSLDRLDSFLELLSSAIDYTESTSNELRPSNGKGPSPTMLKHIKEMVEDINERQAWKASGVSQR